MGFFERLDKLNDAIEKIQDYLDDSPTVLCLSCEPVLQVKVKELLKKYAIYDVVQMTDSSLNGFGVLNVEYLGDDVEKFELVLNKVLFDLLRVYYLGFVRTNAEYKKVDDKQYIVYIYYSFSKKTLRNYEYYFSRMNEYKKRETLEQELLVDIELEREMKEWDI